MKSIHFRWRWRPNNKTAQTARDEVTLEQYNPSDFNLSPLSIVKSQSWCSFYFKSSQREAPPVGTAVGPTLVSSNFYQIQLWISKVFSTGQSFLKTCSNCFRCIWKVLTNMNTIGLNLDFDFKQLKLYLICSIYGLRLTNALFSKSIAQPTFAPPFLSLKYFDTLIGIWFNRLSCVPCRLKI